MPEEARAKIAVELAAALLELRRPHDDKPLVEEVWTREQAFAGPFESIGPDLSMVLADGGTLSILPSETIVARRAVPRGHHRWEGTFIARGPGIRSGAEIEELSLVDIAPLLLYQLGLPRAGGHGGPAAGRDLRAGRARGPAARDGAGQP